MPIFWILRNAYVNDAFLTTIKKYLAESDQAMFEFKLMSNARKSNNSTNTHYASKLNVINSIVIHKSKASQKRKQISDQIVQIESNRLDLRSVELAEEIMKL